jgi:hypothetical protein
LTTEEFEAALEDFPTENLDPPWPPVANDEPVDGATDDPGLMMKMSFPPEGQMITNLFESRTMKRISVLGIYGLLLLVTSSCTFTTFSCSLESMMLLPGELPVSSTLREIRPAIDGTPISMSRTFHFPSGLTSIEINHHRFVFQAKNDFQYLVTTRLNPDYRDRDWSVPLEFQGLQLKATEYQIGCWLKSPEICFLIARYDGLSLRFKSHIADQNGITIDDFKDLMTLLDERISSCTR